MERKLLIGDVEYVGHDLLEVGDYGGSGIVGHANIRALEESDDFESNQIMYYGNFEASDHADMVLREDIIFAADVEKTDLIFLKGGMGSHSAWIRADHPKADETIGALENYPALNDEIVTEVQQEWEDKAWEGQIRGDLLKVIDPDLAEALEDKLDEQGLRSLYGQAMQKSNTQVHYEQSGAYVDVDEVKGAFEQLGREELDRLSQKKSRHQDSDLTP